MQGPLRMTEQSPEGEPEATFAEGLAPNGCYPTRQGSGASEGGAIRSDSLSIYKGGQSEEIRSTEARDRFGLQPPVRTR